MPDRSDFPSKLLSLTRARSPLYTCISTPGWLSEYIEKILFFFVGIVVLRLMRAVMTPPAVSIPRERGGNLEKKILESSQRSRRRGWRLDCKAIGESLIRVDALLLGSLPSKKSETSLTIHGVRVEPLTKMISWMFDLSILESWRTFSTGSRVLRNRSWHSSTPLNRDTNSPVTFLSRP